LAVGGDGNVWFAEYKEDVGSVTPAGDVKDLSWPDECGTADRDIARGPDGNIWFPSSGVGSENRGSIAQLKLQ